MREKDAFIARFLDKRATRHEGKYRQSSSRTPFDHSDERVLRHQAEGMENKGRDELCPAVESRLVNVLLVLGFTVLRIENFYIGLLFLECNIGSK